MASTGEAQIVAPKRKPFKKQIYRGIELDKLLELNTQEMVALLPAKQRRRYRRGIHPKYTRLVKKLKGSVKNQVYGEKPKPVKTHLRNCIVTPEMVGSVCEVYGGKYWTPVEIRADMCGYYLGEFSLTYKPIRHGKVGHGATRGSKFVSNK
jgi:small subunit ribosomal protein S15e